MRLASVGKTYVMLKAASKLKNMLDSNDDTKIKTHLFDKTT